MSAVHIPVGGRRFSWMSQSVKRKLENSSVPSSVTGKVSRTEQDRGIGGSYIEVNGKSCFHRVAWPEGEQNCPSEDAPPVYGEAMAKEFPFELDPFQTTSIACLEAGRRFRIFGSLCMMGVMCLGDSVLVSAHTSAGKTAVAQYACAMALRDKTRMIYTSPLKALSNQKYRELYDDFWDVGLLTGDITIKEDASCLVVTAEVFRAMLYENNNIIHEIKSVVFDEVHYLRDKERGVVWEECLILMPRQVQAIFLSATVPNAFEFASWFASIHGSKCHVVYTENRPVPLQHYIFPAGADGMYMAIDEKGNFMEENFQQACTEIKGSSITSQLKKNKENKHGLDDASDMFKLMQMVLQRGYDPVIVFAFSKRTCEQLALQLVIMDVNDDEEKTLVEQILKNAMDGLSEQDRRLPQVQHILPMLKRGIGVHHSGLLPIVKEVVELLFQEGLIKVLFATETFSTGLNMPAKTVVFAGAKKFDTGGFRWLYSGEYIQMSGRAGRRGIDERGIVILIADKSIDATTARDILKGSPLPLLSAFRISYRMILDNLKLEGGDPETIIRKSFKQFLCRASAPAVEQELQTCRAELDALQLDDTDVAVERFVKDQQERDRLRSVISLRITQPKHCLPFLNPGRLVSVIRKPTGGTDHDNAAAFLEQAESCWGLIVNFKKEHATEAAQDGPEFIVDILINSVKSSDGFEWLSVDDERGTPNVIGFQLSMLSDISSIRVHLPKNLKSVSARIMALKCLKEVLNRLKTEHGKIPLLDPIKDMKISGGKLKKTTKELKKVEEELERNNTATLPDSKLRLEKYFRKQNLLSEIKSLEAELEAAHGMILKHELRHMLRLLVRMEYIDDTGLVLKKGQIALHFRTADELILTEMVFNGQLGALTPQQIAAVVSCIVQPDGNQSETKVPSELTEVFQMLERTADGIGRQAVECKVIKHSDDYLHQFRPYFMEAVHAWSNGASFAEILKVSDIYEGSAVRMIRQVHRVLTELEGAAKVTGQQELEEKIQTAQESLKRDVIFAASLYL